MRWSCGKATQGRGLILSAAVLAAALSLYPLAAGPATAAEAFALRNLNVLLRLDLESGLVTDIGSTGLLVFALAFDPDGDLYAAAKRAGIPRNPLELWILDPATAERTLVGTLLSSGVAIAGDLAFDSSGDLWMTADGRLHSVDLTSGEATSIGDAAGFLQGLAYLGGVLYGIESDVLPAARWTLVRVDTGSGATMPIAPLPALEDQDSLTMDFDAFGRLWILGVGFFPAPGTNTVFRLNDLSAGEVESVVDLDGALFIESLALVPPQTVVIPAVDGAGMVVMVAALVAAGLSRLRRAVPRLP